MFCRATYPVHSCISGISGSLDKLNRFVPLVPAFAGTNRQSDQPPQPPIVTFTSLLVVNREPSFILATAMIFCDLARRMRVFASATPLAGEKWNVTTPPRGLPS